MLILNFAKLLLLFSVSLMSPVSENLNLNVRHEVAFLQKKFWLVWSKLRSLVLYEFYLHVLQFQELPSCAVTYDMAAPKQQIALVIPGGRPWGFSLKGGLEHNKPLVISKVILVSNF